MVHSHPEKSNRRENRECASSSTAKIMHIVCAKSNDIRKYVPMIRKHKNYDMERADYLKYLFIFTNFIIGSCLASHAAVVYEHWNDKNFIYSRSQCNNCHLELSILDEIPLLSYIFLQGKCRYCYQQIPVELFLFELIGGFAFCLLDFSKTQDIITAILLFSLLVVAISDYQKQEFDLLLLIPAISVAILFNQFAAFTLIDWISFTLLLGIFSYSIMQRKMGLGDLLIYLIIACYFTPSFANLVFLFASILVIAIFLIEKTPINHRYPFIPYIFLGLVLTQLIF